MLPPLQLEQSIELIIREEWGRVLAILIKQFGDIQAAEDVLQDAIEIAIPAWRQNGLPASPAAWLVATAKNKAIDRIRRAKNFARIEPEIAYLQSLSQPLQPSPLDQYEEDMDGETIPDKRLELIFTCCHPSLDEKSRTALTLLTLGGLTTEEIARAFLDKPATMAQRLVRAKKKIAANNIPYAIPEAEHLPERVDSVLGVIYLIFNEGYQAYTGQSVSRTDLCDEAIRLARIVRQLMPEHSEVLGLLALQLLHDSRRRARQPSAGKLVSLQEQDRTLWNQAKIEEGLSVLSDAFSLQAVGPYQVQAAISALHAEAKSWEETDWAQIAALYRVLYDLHPTPVVQINRAVAISFQGLPLDALVILEELEGAGHVNAYQPFHAAKADVLLKLGQNALAREHFEKAFELSENTLECDFLKKRIELC